MGIWILIGINNIILEINKIFIIIIKEKISCSILSK